MFTLNLVPNNHLDCEPDFYAKQSAIENMTSRLDDGEFLKQNGRALLAFIENKTDETNTDYSYKLMSALVTTAAIAPLTDVETQIKTASKMSEVLNTVRDEKISEVTAIDFREFYKDANKEAERINSFAGYAATWVDEIPVLPPETVACLEGRFVKTPTFEVLQMFKDNQDNGAATAWGSPAPSTLSLM